MAHFGWGVAGVAVALVAASVGQAQTVTGEAAAAMLFAPGKAEVFEYGGCKDGRVVADVVRLDKGHTEGLEPVVTEELVKLMTKAKGGKIAAGAR